MTTTLRISVLAFALGLAFALAAKAEAVPAPKPAAQTASSAQPVDTTPPSYDMKAQSLLDLDDLQKKFVSLAKAVPADKYDWRPMPGVRSFGEVFL
ncbi:MAG: hypothetical protein WAN23_08570, partial [Candidatus Acidiferrales bacterium]